MGSWRWAALLGFALLAPVGLPAGGASGGAGEVRRRCSRREPLLSGHRACLRTAPQCQAPALADLACGTPLRLLRTWRDPRGRAWLQVEGWDGRGGRQRRGWLPVRQVA